MTASGTQVRHGTLAADTALYPFGTVMYIDGYGYGRVEDRGGAIKGDHIDLFFKSHQSAKAWGRRYKWVSVWYR
jgi:3D (Asp-Asp-Asp) domain-containing protein